MSRPSAARQRRLANAGEYFCFKGSEPAGWLDRTVRGGEVGELALEGWVAEYERLRKVNREILRRPRKNA